MLLRCDAVVPVALQALVPRAFPERVQRVQRGVVLPAIRLRNQQIRSARSPPSLPLSLSFSLPLSLSLSPCSHEGVGVGEARERQQHCERRRPPAPTRGAHPVGVCLKFNLNEVELVQNSFVIHSGVIKN